MPRTMNLLLRAFGWGFVYGVLNIVAFPILLDLSFGAFIITAIPELMMIYMVTAAIYLTIPGVVSGIILGVVHPHVFTSRQKFWLVISVIIVNLFGLLMIFIIDDTFNFRDNILLIALFILFHVVVSISAIRIRRTLVELWEYIDESE